MSNDKKPESLWEQIGFAIGVLGVLSVFALSCGLLFRAFRWGAGF